MSGNWTPSGVPASGDTVYFQNNAVNVDTNLNQSAVALAGLYIAQSYTGKIGTQASALQVGSSLVRIGDPSNSGTQPVGSQRINLDLGTTTGATVVVVQTCQSTADTGQAPVRIKGANAGNILVVYSGYVEIANNAPGETATFPVVDVQPSQTTGAQAAVVYLSSGCTLTTVNQSAGTLTVNSNVTTLTQSAGTLITQGSGTIATLTAGGTAYLNSTGTITTLNAISGGTADFSGDARAKTVTTLNAYKGCTVNLNNGAKNSVTITNPIALQNCYLSDITLKTWLNNTVALA